MSWEARYRDQGPFDEATTLDQLGGQVGTATHIIVLVVQIVNERSFGRDRGRVHKGGSNRTNDLSTNVHPAFVINIVTERIDVLPDPGTQAPGDTIP